MSGGGSVPYNLRLNKSVDRGIFIDNLQLIAKYLPLKDYTYIGLGGPFLEEFKLLHTHLCISKMHSIEFDEWVLKRQEFNKPVSCVSIPQQPISTTEFIDSHVFDGQYVVWLDYTNAQYASQLNDVYSIASKLSHGDVLKVTMQAVPSSLGSGPEDRKQYLTTELDTFVSPELIGLTSITRSGLPKILLKAVCSAVKKGLRESDSLVALLLAANRYEDNAQMVTVTCILLRQDTIDGFHNSTGLIALPESDVMDINVPNMSIKERLTVEALLPAASCEEIAEHLNCRVGSDREVNNFIKFYRLYPWFGRIGV